MKSASSLFLEYARRSTRSCAKDLSIRSSKFVVMMVFSGRRARSLYEGQMISSVMFPLKRRISLTLLKSSTRSRSSSKREAAAARVLISSEPPSSWTSCFANSMPLGSCASLYETPAPTKNASLSSRIFCKREGINLRRSLKMPQFDFSRCSENISDGRAVSKVYSLFVVGPNGVEDLFPIHFHSFVAEARDAPQFR